MESEDLPAVASSGSQLDRFLYPSTSHQKWGQAGVLTAVFVNTDASVNRRSNSPSPQMLTLK